jgi:ribosome biogenesis GTPase / thiamine phosphate phosphatase
LDLKEGVIIKSTGSWYKVRLGKDESLDCKFKGKYKIKGIRSTNPLAVGDKVKVRVDDDGVGLISEILDRKNYIIRRSSNLSKETQIIAANVDIAFLIITIAYPNTHSGFIDRFLASAEAYRIPVQIIFNKVDLYNEDQTIKKNEWIDIYEKIGYPCHNISALNSDDVMTIANIIEGKICVFAGNSGVGKSTLVNSIDPSFKLKTAEISAYHSKGKHTTTFAEMYELDNGGFIIDTPGIKGFGVFDMYKEEISHFFIEIFRLSEACQYNNCTHTHEPKCAVKSAVESGQISEQRYFNYIKLIEDDHEKHRTGY